MRVSRRQAEENRKKVVNRASRLLRERGFDGVGVRELTNCAGFTHGGFYKQFKSKDDLAKQASARAMEETAHLWSEAADNPGEKLGSILDFYLSREHLSKRADGCPLVSLGADVSRRDLDIKRIFEDGIRARLDVLDQTCTIRDRDEPSTSALATLSLMVGALTLSRMINDDALAQNFLDSASEAARVLSKQ